jgi:hypothetical protein
MMYTMQNSCFTFCGISVISLLRAYLVGLLCATGMGKAGADTVSTSHSDLSITESPHQKSENATWTIPSLLTNPGGEGILVVKAMTTANSEEVTRSMGRKSASSDLQDDTGTADAMLVDRKMVSEMEKALIVMVL